MIYPTLELASLQSRYVEDVTTFMRFHADLDVSMFVLDMAGQGKAAEKPVKTILAEMAALGMHGAYVDAHAPAEVQPVLWVWRTALFYQILIVLARCLQDDELYQRFLSGNEVPRPDDPVRLFDFSLGIFGSMSPTSDIDVGVTYTGSSNTPHLAHVVSCFETLFLSLTGAASLDFDIEMYADMLTLPNPDPATRKEHPNYFYLDTSAFKVPHFRRMQHCAGLSIARNALLAEADCGRSAELTFDGILSTVAAAAHVTLPDQARIDEAEFGACVKEMRAFLAMPYAAQRAAYYRHVQAAETELKRLYPGNRLRHVPVDDICTLCVLLGTALAYRKESYLCAPTVVHVVRILQASPADALKYRTVEPLVFCRQQGGIARLLEPICSLGNFGFMLSLLEQLGYMYRFHITYCVCKGDPEKCKKKVKKYLKRWEDAAAHSARFPIRKRSRRRSTKRRSTARPRRTRRSL